jgi:archaetidylinositol phosphate synthase
MLGSLRPFLTKILNPIAKHLDVNPNILTAISPLFAVAAAILFYKHYPLWAAVVILCSGFFDVLDGAVARYHNRTTDFGAFLDSTMDRFSDGIIVIGIVAGQYCGWLVGILLVHSAITVSYVKARAESKGIQCDVGIAERAVRLIIIMVGGIVAYYYNGLYFFYILVALVILSYITVGQRVYHVWKVTEEEKYRFSKRPVTLSKGDKKSKKSKKSSDIDLEKLEEMDKADKEKHSKENSNKGLKSLFGKGKNEDSADASSDFKEKDEEPLERDVKSNIDYEPLFDEEEIGKSKKKSTLDHDFDGVEDDPVIIDDAELSDETFNLDDVVEEFNREDYSAGTEKRKIIRRKKKRD